jgi:hypothetical protein
MSAVRGAKVDVHDDVIGDAIPPGDAPGRLDLGRVALAVAKGHRVHVEALVEGVGEHGRGVEAAGEQEDGGGHSGKLTGARRCTPSLMGRASGLRPRPLWGGAR